MAVSADHIMGNRDVVHADLPAYQPPPPWIPPDKRQGHPDYDNDLRVFLPRTITLNRQDISDSLGFNIRGGIEHRCHFFISRVVDNSEASRVGLQEGDQILSVNDISFDNLDHTQAIDVLKSDLEVRMVVRFFPHGYMKTYERSELAAAGLVNNQRPMSR